MNKVRILLVGNFSFPWMARAWARVLDEYGYLCGTVDQSEYINHTFKDRVLLKIGIKTPLLLFNEAILRKSKSLKPDIVFFYNPYNILAQTMESLKDCFYLAGYNHDYYFSSLTTSYLRLYRDIVGYFDIMHVLRAKEMEKLKNMFPKTIWLQTHHYFCPWDHNTNIPIERNNNVVFIGHAENDLRIPCIKKVIDSNIPIIIGGSSKQWSRFLSNRYLSKIPPIRFINGNDYVNELKNSFCALAFYSDSNSDDYGIRTFEIPACGGLLISQDTKRVCELFVQGKECDVFSNPDELVYKLKYYLQNPDQAQEIREAGAKRCIESGYDIYTRVNFWLNEVLNTYHKK
jgi:spore maturation protein CgeB